MRDGQSVWSISSAVSLFWECGLPVEPPSILKLGAGEREGLSCLGAVRHLGICSCFLQSCERLVVDSGAKVVVEARPSFQPKSRVDLLPRPRPFPSRLRIDCSSMTERCIGCWRRDKAPNGDFDHWEG